VRDGRRRFLQVKMANDAPTLTAPARGGREGVAAYFYSRHIGRIWRVAEALECDIVGINEGIIPTEIAPFGGMKESGIGHWRVTGARNTASGAAQRLWETVGWVEAGTEPPYRPDWPWGSLRGWPRTPDWLERRCASFETAAFTASLRFTSAANWRPGREHIVNRHVGLVSARSFADASNHCPIRLRPPVIACSSAPNPGISKTCS
jgi:hypothetical protein